MEIKIYPNSCLRVKTKLVEHFNQDLKDTLRQMRDLMYLNGGIGLAATQVGSGLSVLVVDIGQGLINFVNPIILERSKEKSCLEEGCLSLPGIVVKVKRPERIKIRAQDEEGSFFTRDFKGLLAKAIQHEMDHLNGRLIIDYLDPIRRLMTIWKLSYSPIKKRTCEVVCNAGTQDTRRT